MATTAAAGSGERFETLDTVRGIAVMGILVMKIAAFAMPFPAYANPAAYGGDSGEIGRASCRERVCAIV